jgi:threonine synthase
VAGLLRFTITRGEAVSEYLIGLVCRECGASAPVEPRSACEECFGPMEPVYDFERIAHWAPRPGGDTTPRSLWRYESLLPARRDELVDLGDGFSPLRRAGRLGLELGLPNLWIKDETRNPTHSFKDRVVSVALTKAREFGFDTVACASTGNLAHAVAAHAARAGLRAVVFVPATLEPAKITAAAVYGATVVSIDGTYDDVNRLCAEATEEYPWAFVNVNLRPYYAEGSKTIAFETAEQLGWRAPDHVVVPIASGALLTRIASAFRQLDAIGWLAQESNVRVSGAQAVGCNPVAAAFESGAEDVRPVRRPETIAKSLAIGDPADGYYALQEVRKSGGAVAQVTEQEIVEAVGLLARTEGIFTETAGGVTIGTLSKLAAEGVIDPGETVVAYVTGMGLKTLDGFGDAFRPTRTIPPKLDALAGQLEGGAR